MPLVGAFPLQPCVLRDRLVQLQPRVGHIAAEFERLANVLLGRGCGNPALITYPLVVRRIGTMG
jgi:hypothetical protein